jgi:hypothetical protein
VANHRAGPARADPASGSNGPAGGVLMKRATIDSETVSAWVKNEHLGRSKMRWRELRAGQRAI